SNLDAKLRDEMRTELKRLQQRLGVTALYVTHDQAEALEMSDLIAVINKGRLVQLDTPQNVYFEPRDAFVAGFMGATNLLKGTTAGTVSAGELGAVKLLDGRMVSCRFPNAIGAGETAVVSVRPEIIRMSRAGQPAAEGMNSLDGVVMSSGFLGQTSRYRVDASGVVLEANADTAADINPGSNVAISFSVAETVGLPESAI
ncbi:MAG: ABC transporter ATP-binding protein, partial [Hyphomicrobiaceae bacterium]